MTDFCYQFAESGTCRYGTSCKFPHVRGKRFPTQKGTTKSGKGTTKTRAWKNDAPAGHLDGFFAQYPAFRFRRNASSTGEFYRLCDFFEWERKNPERKKAHEEFKDALVQEFNTLYGTDVDSIKSWRGLSRALNIDPLPGNVKEAKEIFKTKFINLVDLVDHGRTGRYAKQFTSLEELQSYTISEGKYFPKKSAYAGGMLRFLLREILNNHLGGPSGPRRR